MLRQVVKGLTMLALLLTLAFATGVATANGQAKHKVIASVPFEFVVGEKTLDSGCYTVSAIGISGDALSIQRADGKQSAIRLTNTIAPQTERRARLVFHRYGNTYFLAQVWEGNDGAGLKLKKSGLERAMERELGKIARGNARSVYEEVLIGVENR